MKLNMRFMAGNVIDGILYFSHMNYNALFKMNLDTEEVGFISTFDEIPIDRAYIHRKCLVYKRWLIFIPQNADMIHFINVDSLEQKTVSIADESRYFMIADAIIDDDLLYILPGRIEQRAKILHLDDFRIEIMEDLNNWIREEISDDINKDSAICLGAVIHNKSIYMGLYRRSKIIRYDLGSRDISQIDTDIERIKDISDGSEGIWVTDFENGHIELINDLVEEYRIGQGYSFRRVIENGEYIYAIPGNASRIGLLRGPKGQKELDYPDEFRDFENNHEEKYFGYLIFENTIYLYPYVHDNMLRICEDKLEVVKTEFEYDPENPSMEQFSKIIHAYEKEHIKKTGGIITENTLFGLDAYLDYIKMDDE